MDRNQTAYFEMYREGKLDNLLDHWLVFSEGELTMILAPETVFSDQMLEFMMEQFCIDPFDSKVYAPNNADYNEMLRKQDQLKAGLFNHSLPKYQH